MSLCLEFRRWSPHLSERRLLLPRCWWLGWVEKINRARENRSDADFSARHARSSESVEEFLCFEESSGWLKNDDISFPGYIMALVKSHNLDVSATALLYVISHGHRPGGRQPGTSGYTGTDLLRYFPCVELRNLILRKIARDIFLSSANRVQIEGGVWRPPAQVQQRKGKQSGRGYPSQGHRHFLFPHAVPGRLHRVTASQKKKWQHRE